MSEWAHVKIPLEILQRFHWESLDISNVTDAKLKKQKRAIHIEDTDIDVNKETQQDSRAFGDMGQRRCQFAVNTNVISTVASCMLWYRLPEGSGDFSVVVKASDTKTNLTT